MGRSVAGGWTLIEMIGVLAILSILAVALVPVLMREVDRLTRRDEEARLKAMGVGYQQAAMRNRVISGAPDWAQGIGLQIGWRTEDVLTNGRGGARVFLIDPLLRIGTGAASVLPFTQDWRGSLPPVSARILLISSLGEALPAGLSNGVAANSTAFEAIWGADTETVPAGWTWTGRGSDLCVQRISLAPLFTSVVLNNFDTAAGRFGVDTGQTNLMTSTVFSTWYLRGTVLRLHGNDGLLQSSEVAQDSISYVYENTKWRGRAFMSMGAKRLAGQDLQDAMDLFLAAPWNSNAKFGTKQADAVAALSGYMSQYLAWATAGFPYTTALVKPVKDAQTLIGTSTTQLIFKP